MKPIQLQLKICEYVRLPAGTEGFSCFIRKSNVVVMVEGPAVGKAGNFLDWIAGGLEMNGVKDFGNPCPL